MIGNKDTVKTLNSVSGTTINIPFLKWEIRLFIPLQFAGEERKGYLMVYEHTSTGSQTVTADLFGAQNLPLMPTTSNLYKVMAVLRIISQQETLKQ